VPPEASSGRRRSVTTQGEYGEKRFMRQASGRRFAVTGYHSDCFDGNIIERWLIALRARCLPVRDVGLGLSSDSQTSLDQARKSSRRAARHRNVERILNSKPVRREFSRYPCHCLNGAISSARNCVKARRGTTFKIIRPLVRPSIDQQWEPLTV